MIYYLTVVVSFALGFGACALLVAASRQGRYEVPPPPLSWEERRESEKVLCRQVRTFDNGVED